MQALLTAHELKTIRTEAVDNLESDHMSTLSRWASDTIKTLPPSLRQAAHLGHTTTTVCTPWLTRPAHATDAQLYPSRIARRVMRPITDTHLRSVLGAGISVSEWAEERRPGFTEFRMCTDVSW
jgi:hypothetical protein